MTRPKKTRKHRLNLDLSDESHTLLESLLTRSSAESRTQVIRNALRAYSYLLEVEERGGKVLVQEPDGEQFVLKLL